jgi:hypothetical protein
MIKWLGLFLVVWEWNIAYLIEFRLFIFTSLISTSLITQGHFLYRKYQHLSTPVWLTIGLSDYLAAYERGHHSFLTTSLCSLGNFRNDSPFLDVGIYPSHGGITFSFHWSLGDPRAQGGSQERGRNVSKLNNGKGRKSLTKLSTWMTKLLSLNLWVTLSQVPPSQKETQGETNRVSKRVLTHPQSQVMFCVDLLHQLFCNLNDASESIGGVLDEWIELLAWLEFRMVFWKSGGVN